ncbi:MBL fold metallo-hydrolase [Cellulosimicrobium protaetiae]|uniref:MBL fold metallo-hydrolase n=1 Tax=Cellulosimicrobium protaetiae TaxID=2587808 RepID=A0A6M5UGD6_9MICO|nr:MBL fold metallo-hydrolase [Cellulosimicrobium protaetiae]QJW36692.1 MBL fold metallo-hydrolase [Cellulosimicrobium protaetiae]
MTYTGQVVVGGPGDVRHLDEVVIRKVAVGPLANDVYLLTCRRTGAQVLVDAADSPDDVLALVRAGSPTARLDVVVTTHRHLDHLRALGPVVAATGAAVAVGDPDAEAVAAATGVPVARRLRHGDVLRAGDVVLEVVALRGHTPGSVALAYREPAVVHEPEAAAGRVHLFTGDSLFPGGVGNTQRDPARFERLLTDVTERVFDRFDDATWVYPGHGADTTLGAERPHLGEWRERGW